MEYTRTFITINGKKNVTYHWTNLKKAEMRMKITGFYFQAKQISNYRLLFCMEKLNYKCRCVIFGYGILFFSFQ